MPFDDVTRDPMAAWAISRTIDLEGGLVNNPRDPGGITDYGVSLRFALQEAKAHPDLIPLFDIDHDGHVGPSDIVGLTRELAAEIYYETFWRPGPYAQLNPIFVAWKVFDIAVNTGPKRAGVILQKALVDRGHHELTEDGVIGPQTLAAVQAENDRDGGAGLLMAIRDAQADFYRDLAETEPKLEVFLKGWLRRAAA